ncbi:hypothetical protein GGS23DRAFT_605904 [Durotheca rogersii]|uniref:uncharacterized protein n=1 Tax=Durotheca rogersii TaxID=419775 RepID=UPI00221F1092|nr:uncharacterized protein GGS23DRAFT_605904 [Durotheca rogersii]KAI5861981.1 hypothetical protein GGS23DRAFT_605904 [Durotheca rogersii]
MAERVFQIYSGEQLTAEMVAAAAELYSRSYGVWGPGAPREGKRIRISARQLCAEYLSHPRETLYARAVVDGVLAGQVLCTRWPGADGRLVCWVTLLVVRAEYRRRGLAAALLRCVQSDLDAVYGLLSPNPTACLAAAHAFGTPLDRISLEFIATNAEAVLAASPVPRLRGVRLRGTVFNAATPGSLVAGADTQFFVGRSELLTNLHLIEDQYAWPLGELPPGHEFLLLVPARDRGISPPRPFVPQPVD